MQSDLISSVLRKRLEGFFVLFLVFVLWGGGQCLFFFHLVYFFFCMFVVCLVAEILFLAARSNQVYLDLYKAIDMAQHNILVAELGRH